ncbi:MAG: PhoU domain-containing protein [Thermosphaera sp.]
MTRIVRRVQLTGGSTFTVSLPKKWVEKHGLKPGSPVVIKPVGSQLIVKPFSESEAREERTVRLKAGGGVNGETVLRRIIAAYVTGFDKVVVEAPEGVSPKLRNMVREIVIGKLLGAEIVNEDISLIEIQIFLGYGGVDPYDAVARLGRNARSMLHSACSSMVKENGSSLAEIVKEDDMVDRAYFYAMRLINLIAEGVVEADVSVTELLALRAVIKLVERVGDHVANLAVHAAPLMEEPWLIDEVVGLCMQSLDIFEQSFQAFISKDPLTVDKLAPAVDELRRREESLISNSVSRVSPQTLVSLKMVLESIRRISEYSRDIAELALNLGFTRVVESSSPGKP